MLSESLQRLADARHHAPFDVLGPRRSKRTASLRVLIPHATAVRIEQGPELEAIAPGLFEWRGPRTRLPDRYRLVWSDAAGREHHSLDPYAFPCALDDVALETFAQGTNPALADLLGAHAEHRDGVGGTRFSVWAPHAERVSVIGPFNDWDGRCHPMQVLGTSGVWCVFLPEVGAGTPYRFEIRHRPSGQVLIKSDPMARAFTPDGVSLTDSHSGFGWRDQDWITGRRRRDWRREPISIYEVHLGSWRASDQGPTLRVLAEPLAEHVAALGFTHVELLPVTEHPFGGSWGYQTLGYFATAQRYGRADDLRHFVDTLHRRGIGVLLDWAPAHFPRDAQALAWFDGEPLYEYADPLLALHPDWHTAVFDYGRGEVRSFLLSSAMHWLESFHIDGLRVDAVASMLYRDYSRPGNQWSRNARGGRENLEAVELLRALNTTVSERLPGVLTIAEESTQWPMVTRPVPIGGLGFSLKWNMGWMHDTLNYLRLDPVYRSYHHDLLTFGMLYANSENFLLALSHDEVVHGKSALLQKFPGDDWQKFATLRLLYCYLYGFPGKKLLFMGAEFAARREWNHDDALDWSLLAHAPHAGIARLLGDLNRLYREAPALHGDYEPDGFRWIDCHDHVQSVVSFIRRHGNECLVFVLNFTPVVRSAYRIGLPGAGTYREVLNSDSSHYGGSNVGNAGRVDATDAPWMALPASAVLTLPPLGALVLQRR